MIYLLTKLIAALGGKSDWCTEADAAKLRSYYRR